MKFSDEQIKHMVERFLGWKLPANLSPDNGISFEKIGGKGTPYEFKREGVFAPSGTNLLSAEQATTMVRHMIEGFPESAAPSHLGRQQHFVIGSRDDAIDTDLRHAGWQRAPNFSGKMAWLNPEGEIVQRAREPNQMQGWERCKFYVTASAGSLSNMVCNDLLQMAAMRRFEIIYVRDKVTW